MQRIGSLMEYTVQQLPPVLSLHLHETCSFHDDAVENAYKPNSCDVRAVPRIVVHKNRPVPNF